MIDRAELIDRVSAIQDRLYLLEESLQGEARALLKELITAFGDAQTATWRDMINAADADAGDTAKPSQRDPEDQLGGPHPDPEGRFLLIMHDRNAAGWLWMRRFKTKADAMCICENYTGAEQVWLYEVAREFNLEEEGKEFWRVITEQHVATLSPSPIERTEGG